MQKHAEIYLEYFDLSPVDFIPSEISGKTANAFHHIHRRGMGGDPELDRVENIMPVTDEEHVEYGDIVYLKASLYKIHKLHLKAKGKPFDEGWIDAQIEKYSIFE